MQAEIITIGDEILIGQITDTNSAWIASELNLIGIPVGQITTISDKHAPILSALQNAKTNSDLVLITGGLGPTKDDITKKALCDFFDTHLVLNKEILNHIIKLIGLHRPGMLDINKAQAEIPEKSIPLSNPEGTAPGLWLEQDETIFIVMPGVPYEMKTIMRNEALPRIKKHIQKEAIFHKTFLTTGIPESMLSDRLKEWEARLPTAISCAYLPSPGVNRVRLSAAGNNYEELKQTIETEITKAKELLGEHIFGFDEQTIQQITGEMLQKNNKTLATAESCTGGNIAHLITLVPGCSDYFIGSVVAYSNRIKENILHVNPQNIEKHGAVSQQVVTEMAKGIRELFKTDYGVATSGIAGPTGGSDDKPVGTTWIAVASKDNIIAEKHFFGKNRERTITKASIMALNMLRKFIINE